MIRLLLGICVSIKPYIIFALDFSDFEYVSMLLNELSSVFTVYLPIGGDVEVKGWCFFAYCLSCRYS